MSTKRAVWIVAAGLLAPVFAVTSATADAAEIRNSRGAQKVVVSQDRLRDDSYAARAHARDPAGDYKGYPDWARAALGSRGPAR